MDGQVFGAEAINGDTVEPLFFEPGLFVTGVVYLGSGELPPRISTGGTWLLHFLGSDGTTNLGVAALIVPDQVVEAFIGSNDTVELNDGNVEPISSLAAEVGQLVLLKVCNSPQGLRPSPLRTRRESPFSVLSNS